MQCNSLYYNQKLITSNVDLEINLGNNMQANDKEMTQE